MAPSDSWEEWRIHVLAKLDDQHNDHLEVRKQLESLTLLIHANNIKTAKLDTEVKIKSSLYGGMVSVIISIAASLITWALTTK